MKKQSGRTSIASIVLTIVLLIILVITFNYFRASYFNGFEKAVIKNADTKFTRDSKITTSKEKSYKIENNNFNGEVEYYNGTLYWIRFDENWKETGKKNLFEMFNIQSTMVADFEPLEDEIDIDSIGELKAVTNNIDGTVCIMNKINELVQAVKQINKEVKKLKEDK